MTPSHLVSSHTHICVAARSDVGMKRAMNQDALDFQLSDESEWTSMGHRFVVADGMGAHAAGELASQLAVEEVARHYAESSEPARQALADALRAANRTIHDRGQSDRQLYNMGTTCSCLLLLPAGALVAHVGDSRVYRLRQSNIQQLTFDHSLVWEMRAAGQVREASHTSNIPRNVITRCLGPHSDVEVDTEGFFSVQKDDTFLLCSDGLTGRISDAEIGAITSALDPDTAVDFLVNLANLRGGSDNITVIVARVINDCLASTGELRDADSSNKPTNPAWWLAVGTGLIMALICYQLGHLWLAASGIAITVVSAIGAFVQWFLAKTAGSSDSRLPSPPYASSKATVDDEFVQGICDTLEIVASQLPDEQFSAELADEIQSILNAPGESAEWRCQQLANLSARTREKQ